MGVGWVDGGDKAFKIRGTDKVNGGTDQKERK